MKTFLISLTIFSTACAMEQTDAVEMPPLNTQESEHAKPLSIPLVMNTKTVVSFDPNEVETFTLNTFKANIANAEQSNKPYILAVVKGKKDDETEGVFFYDGRQLLENYKKATSLRNPQTNLDVRPGKIKYYVIKKDNLDFIASHKDVIGHTDAGSALDALLHETVIAIPKVPKDLERQILGCGAACGIVSSACLPFVIFVLIIVFI